MNCKQQLVEYAGLIEEYLPDRIFTGEEVNQVDKAMAYSLCGGGKRIRGAMALAFYRLFHEDVLPALPLASALEMIHAYSLIHDDLPCMDNDDLRRGKPSCHIAFGEAVALLAGDGLLTLAFGTVADKKNLRYFTADQLLAVSWELAKAAGTKGMIGGQIMDLSNEGKAVPAEILRLTDSKKTGALFNASARIGCILGGAQDSLLQAALVYTGRIGLAFQIVDDILDCTGNEETLGKPINSDVVQKKSTYVSLYGIDECRRIVGSLNKEAKEALQKTGLNTEFLCALADYLTIRQR